jgi:hypothetical protein
MPVPRMDPDTEESLDYFLDHKDGYELAQSTGCIQDMVREMRVELRALRKVVDGPKCVNCQDTGTISVTGQGFQGMKLPCSGCAEKR